MKTLLIPLDERPCNRVFPQMITYSNTEVELLVPPINVLGDKKQPAQVSKIKDFLYENIRDVDNLIISLDMILYGGLIPSRIHYLKKEELLERLNIIKKLKAVNPKCKVYAFQCIMRAPDYDSSEEEPDYYDEYGSALFRRKYLIDLKNRQGLVEAQQRELDSIVIPDNIVNDYELRRDINTLMNIEVLNFLEKEIIDFLVIPQDDSSPFGYTAIAQKKVIDEIKKRSLDMKVMVYPGADEVAMSLLTRAYHDYLNIEPKVYAFYASVLGPTIIPKYEDRPMLESLKYHVRVCKSKLVKDIDKADIVLAINCPGKIMQESFVSENEKDVSYTSYRCLLDFSNQIRDYIDQGYKVALCDSAFSNGGDLQLIRYLDELDVLDKLISYAGWNTNCNSLGTTLSQAVMGYNINHLCYRIIEDVFYQTIVRKDVVDNELPKLGLSYYEFKDRQCDVENIIKDKLQNYYNSLKISHKHLVNINTISMPWHRMFEIAMEIEVS